MPILFSPASNIIFLSFRIKSNIGSGKVRDKVFLYSDYSSTGSTSSVGSRKSFMQIKMNNIESGISGLDDSQGSVKVSSIIIEQTTFTMDNLFNFFYSFIE